MVKVATEFKPVELVPNIKRLQMIRLLEYDHFQGSDPPVLKVIEVEWRQQKRICILILCGTILPEALKSGRRSTRKFQAI